jgi:hypothetical protein
VVLPAAPFNAACAPLSSTVATVPLAILRAALLAMHMMLTAPTIFLCCMPLHLVINEPYIIPLDYIVPLDYINSLEMGKEFKLEMGKEFKTIIPLLVYRG